MTKNESIELEFDALKLSQNRVYYTQHINFLNSFENMRTNETV